MARSTPAEVIGNKLRHCPSGNAAKLCGENTMASWVKCTTTDDAEIRLNLDQVAMIRPYHSDRGFSGSEVIFAAGSQSPIVVKEDRDVLTGSRSAQQNL
jgi:hypothetical protein